MNATPPPIRNLARLNERALRRIRLLVDGVHTLGDLLEHGESRSRDVHVDDVITQDEYTHDVLVPLEPPVWLAFDVT